ncbi:hypothetical protein ABZW30_31565 [Kitasatospora sp. NPDC004669]
MPIGRVYWNSRYIAAATVAATLLTGATAACAFAWIPFCGLAPWGLGGR